MKITMKKHLLILLTALLSAAPLLAQYSPCYEAAFAEGKRLYNAGQYAQAKKYFNEAKSCPDPNEVAVNDMIGKCNSMLVKTKPEGPVNKESEADKEMKAYNNCTTVAACESYLNAYPYGKYVAEVRNKKLELQVESETIEFAKNNPGPLTITVNGASFVMKPVVGGTFMMGAQKDNPNGPNYDSEATDYEKPVHKVTVRPFYIGETEVTRELFYAVMGEENRNEYYQTGLSTYEYNNLPIEADRSFERFEKFIKKLNLITGCSFRLPTEAEWEYAARGGGRSKGYKYAGSNNIDDVAWLMDNKKSRVFGSAAWLPNVVKGKQPNELGLYDMSGNVRELCSDWYGEYEANAQIDPQGPSTGTKHVSRGGGYADHQINCKKVTTRVPAENLFLQSIVDVGFRLVFSFKDLTTVCNYIKAHPTPPNNNTDASDGLAFTVNGVKFIMKPVEGGSFQTVYKPIHSVAVNTFYMGETEVTQALWKAVMGDNPSNRYVGNDFPVNMVSWKDVQDFINKLNKLTGKNFRLPTEAEWEFAARGGNKSKGYEHCGSNNVWDVKYHDLKDEKPIYVGKVGSMMPNELGLYDMTGNVAEWCQDWYDTFKDRVVRNDIRSNTSSKEAVSPNNRGDNIGFRLALSR